jgi:hypothetical protein
VHLRRPALKKGGVKKHKCCTAENMFSHNMYYVNYWPVSSQLQHKMAKNGLKVDIYAALRHAHAPARV